MSRITRMSRRALGAAVIAAAGLLVTAPSAARADTATGCGGSYRLAAGQAAVCTFAYAGPNASGWWTDNVGANAASGSGLASVRLESGAGLTGALQIIDQCESVASPAGGSGCGTSTAGSAAAPTGAPVYCVIQNLGAAVEQGNFFCATGY